MDRPIQQFDMTYERYEALCTKAQAQGVSIAGDSGAAMKFGVGVMWHYIAPTLSIQVTNVPFFLSPETVEQRIAELVKESLL